MGVVVESVLRVYVGCKARHLIAYASPLCGHAWPRPGSFGATNLLKTFLRPKNFSRKFPKEASITHTSKNCAAANVGGRYVGDSNGDRGIVMARYAGELLITDRTLRGRVGYLRSLDLV